MAKPKLPKRPKATSGIGSLEAHLKAIKAVQKKYREKLRAAQLAEKQKLAAFKKRVALNKAIDKARAEFARMK